MKPKLSRRKTRALLFMGLLIALFPPWVVRERPNTGAPFSPPHAGNIRFILEPPSESSHPTFARRTVAVIDTPRLLVEYLALACFAGVLALPRPSKPKRPKSGDEPKGEPA